MRTGAQHPEGGEKAPQPPAAMLGGMKDVWAPPSRAGSHRGLSLWDGGSRRTFLCHLPAQHPAERGKRDPPMLLGPTTLLHPCLCLPIH